MQKDIENNQDKLYQDRLRRSKVILEDIRSGIWDQEHGTVPPEVYSQQKNQDINQKK